MKSSYYDLTDKYYGGFCGSGDMVSVVDESKVITRGVVKKCSITCISFQAPSNELWTVPRTSIVSVEHCIQERNHIPVELCDLISMPQGEDRDIRCLGVVTRVNAPYAAIRVLTGQQMSEVINVWLKKLQFVAKGFSLDLYNELEEEDMNISYNSLSECLNLVADQFTSFSELFNPLVTRAKLLANPLFRSDVIANDKLKRWGKGVLQKTKAMATLLSTPTEQDRSSSVSSVVAQSPRIPTSDEDMMISKPASRGKSSPEISFTRRSSDTYGDLAGDDGKHANRGFFSRIFKSKKKDLSRERAPSPRGSAPSLLERDDSRDSLLGSPREAFFPTGSFDPFSERRSSDMALRRRCSEGGRFACVSPRVRRSHRHYRSFSDDVSGERRGDEDGWDDDLLDLGAMERGIGDEWDGDHAVDDGYGDECGDFVPGDVGDDYDDVIRDGHGDDMDDAIYGCSEDTRDPSTEDVHAARSDAEGVPDPLGSNLLDLSSLAVSQPCEVASETQMTPPTDPIRNTDGSVDAKVKKSRIARMERLLGRRTVPPFRRRVAFLPPLPLATAQNAGDRPRDGKQVRFFTNVICHEYRSY